MRYIASFSGGKDSTAMVLKLIEESWPLDEIVFFDTGMEFKAVYAVVEHVKNIASQEGIKFTTLKPKIDFMLKMMCKPVRCRHHYGYDWCGGRTRWGTSEKQNTINKYLSNDDIQYIGIAFDEQRRVKNKRYPLIEWHMTEKDCLEYCRQHGISWDEDGIDLYDILDRVSCWCCANKNIKELRAIRKYLPQYWGLLLGMQSRIDRPFRSDGKTLFDLDKRFADEERSEQ